MRKLLAAGVATIVLAGVGYYMIPRAPSARVADRRNVPTQDGNGSSEASEAGIAVRPVPDVTDPMRGLVETIVVERPAGSSADDEVVVFKIQSPQVRPTLFTEPPAEHMSPAPHPDTTRARMPLADETPPAAEPEPPAADEGVQEESEPIAPPAPMVDYHREHPSCPRSGICPVPHVSYPLPNRVIER